MCGEGVRYVSKDALRVLPEMESIGVQLLGES
jgi:hypothetical protein